MISLGGHKCHDLKTCHSSVSKLCNCGKMLIHWLKVGIRMDRTWRTLLWNPSRCPALWHGSGIWESNILNHQILCTHKFHIPSDFRVTIKLPFTPDDHYWPLLTILGHSELIELAQLWHWLYHITPDGMSTLLSRSSIFWYILLNHHWSPIKPHWIHVKHR